MATREALRRAFTPLSNPSFEQDLANHDKLRQATEEDRTELDAKLFAQSDAEFRNNFDQASAASAYFSQQHGLSAKMHDPKSFFFGQDSADGPLMSGAGPEYVFSCYGEVQRRKPVHGGRPPASNGQSAFVDVCDEEPEWFKTYDDGLEECCADSEDVQNLANFIAEGLKGADAPHFKYLLSQMTAPVKRAVQRVLSCSACTL